MAASGRLEQERFLRAFHRRHPGVTARALGRGRVAEGGSSYDAVARRIAGARRVVDLGCGDGALLAVIAAPLMIGLDLSRGELEAARARRLPALWLEARAQALPLRDAVADAVVSHLAFTLMAAPDEVVAEIGRVLVPGGRFVAVVGGGPRGDDAYAGMLDLVLPAVRAAAVPIPRLGEVRARSEAGLRALFAGWGAPELEDLPIDLSGTPDEVWASLATIYDLDGLAADLIDQLRRDFVAAAPRWRRADGAIACTMATTLVTVARP